MEFLVIRMFRCSVLLFMTDKELQQEERLGKHEELLEEPLDNSSFN